MNKRNVTKPKGSKVKANNDPGEVFVLPPNLLEALGINLGNIETAPECTSGNQISEKKLTYKENSTGLGTPHNLSEINFATSPEKELSATNTAAQNLFSKEEFGGQVTLASIPETNNTTSSENESSNIHTANLMKASMFLSPTFISNNRSIIEGEVEILGSDKLVENAISMPNTYSKNEECDQIEYTIGGVTFPNQHQDTFTVSNFENSSDAKSSETVKETNKVVQSINVHVENLAKDVNFDDHTDEAYLSDGSNGNVEMNDKLDGSNNSVYLPTNNNKKINIISEQILDPSQFKACQSSYSDRKKCLIPVAMSTVLKNSFINTNCYQNSINAINNDCNPNVVTYYVQPSVKIDSNLHDPNVQKTECEYNTDPVLKNESFTDNDYVNQNAVAGDSLDYHFTHNILSNVSEDIVIETQMQEGSSQHAFKGHESEYTHLVFPNTLYCKEKCNEMETCTSDIRNTNTIATNNEEMELNETLQKVDLNDLDIQNFCVNRNYLSSISEDITDSARMQEVSSQHELEMHKSMFDIHIVLADTFNCEDSDRRMETNVSDVMSTNTFTTKINEEKVNATLQKVNPNALDEQKIYIDCNKMPTENEDGVITTKKQEGSSCLAFEEHKKELDSQLVLPETLDCANSGNITETNISDTKTSNTITTNYEEQNINETLEKIDPSAVDEQNFHVDVTHQQLTKAVPDKVNKKLTKNKENNRKTSRDAKRKSDICFVEASEINSVSKEHLSQTNINKQKLNNKVKSKQVIKKELKRNRHKNTNLKVKDVLVKAEDKPTQQSPEELCNSCIVPDSNTKNIQCSNKSLSTGTADKQVIKKVLKRNRHNNTNLKIKDVLVKAEAKPTKQSPEELCNSCIVPDSNTKNIQCSNKSLSTGTADKQVIKKVLKHNRHKNTNLKIKDVLVKAEAKPTQQSPEELCNSSIVTDSNTKNVQCSNKSLSTGTSDKQVIKKVLKRNRHKNTNLKFKDVLVKAEAKPTQESKEELCNSCIVPDSNTKNIQCSNKSLSTGTADKQVIKKVLKRNRHKNTNLKVKDVLVKAEANLTQQSPEELSNSCIVPASNTKTIQCSNKSLSTGIAGHSMQLGRMRINNEVQEHKIREIAGYLRKFAELQKRRKISKEKQNISSIKIFTNKKYATNTKLSIQGVEKPGGLKKVKDLKSDKNVKTYERKRINKPAVKVLWNTPNFDTPTQKINLSGNSSYNTLKDTDFCLCDNFGRLIYYDDDDESMYEHIHFWNRKEVDCTPDLIFSIYNENVPADIDKDDDVKNWQDYSYIPIEKNCAPDRKVCWNEINFIDSQGFNEEGSEQIVISSRERIEINPLNIDKPNESSVDEQMKPDASNGSRSLAKNTENWHEKATESVSLLENSQETINNNIVPDINPMKNEKKRKYSSTFNESDKPTVTQHVTNSQLTALVKSDTIVKKQRCSEKELTEKIVPGDQSDSEGRFAISLNKDTSAVCGVCHQNINDTDWLKHIASQHNYLSWRVDEEPLDLKNRQLLIQHLATLIKQYGVLSCNKCGTIRKYAKPFLQHINQCATVEQNQRESISPSSELDAKSNAVSYDSIGSNSIHHAYVKKQPEPVRLVECGVCGESIQDKDWNSHIGSQHNYLAWKKGEQTLDIDDRDEVKEHLYNIVKECGGLKCAKCGVIRKYVKSYQTHINSCDGQSVSESLNESSKGFLHIVSEVEAVRYVSDPVNNVSIENEAELVTDDLIKCGVCGEFMHSKAWNSHIGSKHNYLAWKLGESTLDVDDEVAVKEHLNSIVKECGGLKCAKCGLIRKYVKSYQNHIRNCDGMSESISGCATNSLLDFSEIEPTQHVNDIISNNSVKNEVVTTTDIIQCAVCGDSMHHSNWYDHIGYQHSYLAWRCGDPTLDFDDQEATYKHLYAITKEYGGLKCVKCGLNRKYVKSYLTHVKSCTGLSNSQIDSSINESLNISEVEPAKVISNSITNLTFENEVNGILIKCGVCEQIVQNNNWYNHIRLEHNYLAWKYGEPALDVENEDSVREHLNNITKEFGRLNCTKCGITRKYVRSYLTHVKSCGGLSTKDDNPTADDSTPNIVVLSEAEQHTGLTKCGVCGQYMPLTDWTAHIEGKHNYLAWKDGELPLDLNDKEELREHLKNIVKEIGSLVCVKCGAQRKFAKSYLQHIDKCDGSEEAANSSKVTDEVIWPAAGADQVKCGVCDELVQVSLWIKHIAERHNYLAKKVGETPLNVDDEEEVYMHLYDIVKDNGGLACQKCGIERKYVKSYLEHIRKCGQDLSETGNTTFEANTTLDTSECLVDFYSGGTCGVCDKEVETGKWIQHIQKEHNYLAWRKGEKPWDLDDFTEVNEYLYEITKKMGGLTCNKCGLVRKYVKSYLTHIKSCNVVDFNLTSVVPDGVGPVSDTAYRCAMCQKEIEPSNWKNHAMKEHYNITWIIGETPIDIKNPYAVEKYLKEYKLTNSLKCNNCGATRASFAGFYAHIITCGKSEEQIEMFQSVCDICNNKYLCIYKNQHMMIHRVQSYNKLVKMSKETVESVSSGKRRAAQKAQTVIETYSSDMSQHSHKCGTCGFGTDFKEELQSHKCDPNEKDFSEEESSAMEGEGSEDESADSEVDSDISREEADQLQTLRRKRCKEPVSGGSKLSKINFKVDNPNAFLEQSDTDFCNAFFTDETLFPKWISCKRETVSENDLPKYLPPMEQSCKVKAGFDWTTLKRFEAKSGDGTSMFVGACIVCIAWIPLRVEDITGDSQNFLAVACHNGVDCPRYECDETPQHANLIQIWDFGACKEELPRIVYGIAHDFGTVWSMDWCPSGARDVLPENLTDGQPYRLGLLAVACSNGSAYIFSVPHPSAVVEDNHFIQKLKPVAELRMQMLSARKVYQATSVSWSKEKGHEIILVGYADGSTGYYDINNDSPLSWRVEDGVDIFFPFNEERPHNTCITATDMVPRLGGGVVACSASATGAEMSIPGAGVRVRSHLPARAALLAPHWPATLLAGDIAIMSTTVNELEWTPPARKLGGVRALAGCARCGRVAAAAPPALRVMRPHPAYPEFRKPIVGMVEMIPYAKNRNKQVNDELAMKIEPLTYPDAITKYGIRFQSVSKRDKVLQQQCASKPKAHFPERFPLADVESMAFCPAKLHHDRLAVATHSGIVFFTNVNM